MCADAIVEDTCAVGHVHITKRNSKGEVIYEHTFKNKITNYARACTALLWAGQGSSLALPSAMAIGNGTSTSGVQATDTALWSEMAGTRKECDFITTWMSYNTQFSVTYQATDALGTWTEIGLFDANNNLWSHVPISGVTKDSGEQITIQWQVYHMGN